MKLFPQYLRVKGFFLSVNSHVDFKVLLCRESLSTLFASTYKASLQCEFSCGNEGCLLCKTLSTLTASVRLLS